MWNLVYAAAILIITNSIVIPIVTVCKLAGIQKAVEALKSR